jgi:hypothetical protein
MTQRRISPSFHPLIIFQYRHSIGQNIETAFANSCQEIDDCEAAAENQGGNDWQNSAGLKKKFPAIFGDYPRCSFFLKAQIWN